MTSLVGKLQGVDCWIKIRNSALPALRTIWKFTEYRNPAFLAVGLVLSTAVWRALKRTFRQFISARTTVLLDLPNLGNSRPNEARIKGTAVVIGGSIAGLWTARVLADHFEDVLIVEPEEWLSTEEGKSGVYNALGEAIKDARIHKRSRVFQYTSIHAFQALSLLGLNKLYPGGLVEDLIRKNDGRVLPADNHVHVSGRRILRYPIDEYPPGTKDAPQNVFATRECYERTLRGLVTKYGPHERIRWMVGTATGVKAQDESEESNKITSVIVRTREAKDEEVSTSLVADCSGRAQLGLRWLKRLNHGPSGSSPVSAAIYDELKDEYNTHQYYRGYDKTGFIWMFMPKFGLEKEYIIIDRVDGHRINVGFGGWDDPPIPRDVTEIRDYLKNLKCDEPPPEWLYDVLDILLEFKNSVAIEDIKYPSLYWNHYERLSSIPSNFVAIGDSVQFLNPIFGQGCTKASMGAVTLDSLLRSQPVIRDTEIPSGFGSKFFKIHAARIAGAWQGTKPTDYQWPSTTPVRGEKLSDENFNGEISRIIMELCARGDKQVDSALWHVRSFLAPPIDLFQPTILLKVLCFWVGRKLGLN